MSSALKMATGNVSDIIDTVGNIDSLATLSAVLKSAGLIETLKGNGPFTLFAPSDEAFTKLPEGALERLLKPKNAADLKRLLNFHLVAGRVMSGYIKGKKFNRKPVDGPDLTLDGMNGFSINKVKVISADIPASNGVIHLIGSVLALPKT
jgi:uncharacterized surface protein with fasciclin (FAS1) repeats